MKVREEESIEVKVLVGPERLGSKNKTWPEFTGL